MLGQVPLTTELSQFPGSLAVGQGLGTDVGMVVEGVGTKEF